MTAVRIPPVLRAQAGNQKKVEVTGSTVGEALESLLVPARIVEVCLGARVIICEHARGAMGATDAGDSHGR